jgi:acetyl-CoA carboxylase biotin carboxylase subunit
MVLMGDKANARETMRRAGVPVVPGSDGLIDDAAAALAYAETIGYPVMIKASSGGGGRGIRKVDKAENMEQAFQAATTEALACFGNGRVYIEKYLGDPRHIEVQILADNYGNVVHLGERDCSLQRKNQKMIEEAPAYFLDKETREKMGQAAVNAAKSVGYRNAGTIEFLVDNDKNFYFMEMNTRIQVEHPVTEMITGVDLVQQQIKIAAGEPIGFSQKDVHCRGHAIECRICAEDPYKHFAPCPGKIVALHMSGGPGVRIDSAVYQDYSIPSHYDSMIAKVIVHAPTRDEAIRRMRRALAETVIEGIMTNVDYHLEILRQEEYLSGDVDIGFLGRMDALFGSGSKSS